jgi:hypothetical protein
LRISGTTVIRYDESQKIEKPKSLQAFGSMTIKGPKKDSQNWVRSPIPEGGETYFKKSFYR